ncbi:MAG: AAA family ATPase [Myxococcota bacterium]
MSLNEWEIGEAEDIFARLRARLRSAVIGRDAVIDLVLVALVADGHVLLEDFPGSGKTTLAKALGEAIVDDQPSPKDIRGFRRIQFTPDLLPSDVTGTSVFSREESTFHFRPGPIFAHVLLADEINRTSPKVQAALLEAMAEKQVTVDDATRPLDEVFFVMATQNPLDLAGTYPLPVAQLDRFLFKIRMTHLDPASEMEVLRSIEERRRGPTVDPVPRSSVITLRERADKVFVHEAIHEALVDCAQRLRSDERTLQGVSTRSLVLAVPALKARALMQGRSHVQSEDLELLLPYVFGHRMETAGGVQLEEVLNDALAPALERLARRTLMEAS